VIISRADIIPLYDVICYRSVMLIRRCLQSDSHMLKFVSNLFHAAMKSESQCCCM